jgi:hypothetical protein
VKPKRSHLHESQKGHMSGTTFGGVDNNNLDLSVKSYIAFASGLFPI